MPQVIRTLSLFSVICFVSLALMIVFVPSLRGQDSLLRVEGWHGTVVRVLIAAGALSYAISIMLRFTRRRQVAMIDWPSVPLEPQVILAETSELRVVFEQESETWVFSVDGKNIAAFREVQEKLGIEVRVFDRRYTVARKFLQFGGTLMLDGVEVAKGSMPFARAISAGGKIYSLRGSWFPALRKSYQMFLDEALVCAYTRQQRNEWRICNGGRVDLPIVVFGFWLIRHPAD